jgi:hypothetical protein
VTVEEITTSAKSIWEDLLLEELQFVFFNWIEHLEWVIEYRKNATLIDIKNPSKPALYREVRGELVCTPDISPGPDHVVHRDAQFL